MPDPRFFARSGPHSLARLAELAGAEPAPGVDPDFQVADVGSLDTAGPAELAFCDGARNRAALAASHAGACILPRALAEAAPAGMRLLFSEQPQVAFGAVARLFYPGPAEPSGIDASARVDPAARLDPGCRIGACAVVGAGAEIGAGTVLGPHVVVGAGVAIGRDCRIGAGVTLSHAVIGDRVVIAPGARLGQPGFGFVQHEGRHLRVPQLGRVVIGDGVEIGANTTIDRGALGDTEIGAGTVIDNLVQIAHNVRIGRGCVVLALAGIAGSAVLEDYVILAGQAGLNGHTKVGKAARIAAHSGVIRDVEPGADMAGAPAVPARQFWRQVALLARLAKQRGG